MGHIQQRRSPNQEVYLTPRSAAAPAVEFIGRHTHERQEGFGAKTWTGFDWDTMNRLHEKGFIRNPVSKAKSVGMTEAGFKLSESLFEKFLCEIRPPPAKKNAEPDRKTMRFFVKTCSGSKGWKPANYPNTLES